ncbi:MAG: hypothetical protein IJZ88_01905 [Clostridia bacterium]|nr:hypothetical protein [Clostridia bacterium]
MFVIVDMSDGQKRIFEKFRKHEIELKRHDVKGCAPFFVAHCHRDYTDFDELKKIVSRYGVALFAQNDILTQKLTPVAFTPTVLPLKMLIKTVGEFFARQSERCNLSVAVIDKSARACDTMSTLAENVRYVRVITSRFDRYEICASEIFASYGISIDLSDNVASAYGSDVVISVDDAGLSNFDRGKIICYKKQTQNKNVFTLSQSDLNYAKFDCERYGIDKFTFICALYETCGYHLPHIPCFKDMGELNHIL